MTALPKTSSVQFVRLYSVCLY